MGVGYNPRIVTDGLVLCLDAANPRSAPTTAIESAVVSSVTGSGPSYNVVYTTNVSAARVGDKVNVEKREAGAGTSSTVLSTYTYEITGLDRSLNQLTLTYESDTGSLGDDSPADLPSGGGSSGSPEIAPHDIVSLWIDMKGGNNGTPTNGPTFSSDNGGGIVFDGSNDRVDTGVNPATLVGNGNPATISAWFYPSTTNQRLIFGQGTYDRFYIEQYYRSGSLVAHWGFGDSQNALTSQAFINTNTWYNYTATYDGSIANGYLNGINTDTTSIGGSKTYSGSLSVGSWGPSNGFYFSGRISTVNVYNRALSAKEVLQNYEATKGRYA